MTQLSGQWTRKSFSPRQKLLNVLFLVFVVSLKLIRNNTVRGAGRLFLPKLLTVKKFRRSFKLTSPKCERFRLIVLLNQSVLRVLFLTVGL